jgi:signal transduction histidine kinase/ActR/RegA family two-component response regulator/transcriptional regulator with GAF, ATPase, and Fis domain
MARRVGKSLRSRWLDAWPVLLVAAVAALVAVAADGGLWQIAVAVVALVALSAAMLAGLDRSSFTSGRAVDKAAARLRRLENVSAVPIHAAPLEPFLQDMAQRLRAAMAADYSAVLLADGEILTIRAADGSTQADLGARIRFGDGLVGRVAVDATTQALTAIHLNDVAVPSLGRGINSAIAAPLQIGDEVRGVVVVGHRDEVEYDLNDTALLEIAAERLATAVETARLGESEWRSSLGAARAREHLRMLGDTSRVLMRSVDDYEGPLTDVIATVIDDFATLAAVFLADGTNGAMRVVAARMHGSTQQIEFDPGSLQPIRDAMAAGNSRLRICGDPMLAREPERAFLTTMRELEIVSYVISPIQVRGLSFGALLFGTGKGARGYRPSDHDAIDELSRRVALAIEGNLLYREARGSAAATARHLQRLRSLLDTKLGIGSATQRTAILNTAAEGAARLFPGSNIVVALGDEQYTGTRTPVTPPLSPLAVDLLGSGSLLSREFGAARLALSESDRRLVTGRCVAVPLAKLTDEEPGFILVDNDDDSFSDEDESVLVLLSRMVSSALANDELNEQTRAGAARLVAIFAASPAAIVTMTPEFGVEGYNPAAEELFGWPDDGTSGKLPDDVLSCVRDLAERVADAHRAQQHELTTDLDGLSSTLVLMLAPVAAEQGVVSGYVLVVTDDTERLQLARQFQEAQRLEAIGRLAGGVAHDFNNLLTVIHGYTDGLLRRLQEDDPNRDRIAAIHRAGRRGAELTKQLLTISRQQVVTPVVLRPAMLMDEVTDMLRRMVGEAVRVVREPGDDDARVRIDKLQLEQVLLNLAGNARDALPGGGTLRMSVHRTPHGPQTSAWVPQAGLGDDSDWVELRVADDGIGMDATTLERCLDPLFTTKEAGEGTGFGLSAVYGIAKQNGGDIRIVSSPGNGTTVTVVLPHVTADLSEVLELPLPTPHDKADTGHETILLVEDDHEIRWMVWRLLHERGYETLVADTALEALEVMRQNAGEVDLLLTDVAMPGMSGPELARAVREIRPVPVLFMSGYAEKLSHAADRGGPNADFLAKPFTPDELVEKVRVGLGHPESPGTDASESPGSDASGLAGSSEPEPSGQGSNR